jgi:hypothetical protein
MRLLDKMGMLSRRSRFKVVSSAGGEEFRQWSAQTLTLDAARKSAPGLGADRL